MASRRQETSLPKDRPVKFYKIVALTFLFITIILVGSIIFMTSKRATITITSKTQPVETSATAIISSEKTKSSKVIPGSVTTTNIAVTDNFKPQGEKAKPSTATGTITIHNKSAQPQPLVAATRFLSEDGVLFRLENRVRVPANGKIEAEAYADQKGKQGNIKPTRFTIPGLSESRQEQVYGTSDEPMIGGVEKMGVVSEQDMDMAKEKLRQTVIKQARDNFQSDTSDKQNILTKIIDYSTTSSVQTGTQVSSFPLTAKAKVAVVKYNPKEVNQFASQALKEKSVSGSQLIKKTKKEPTVNFKEYLSDKNQAKISLYIKGISSLNPNSKKIKKKMFFGKSEREVRRYLLSLDHVHAVDIEFSPGWINDVPHVADHVNVVVKKVK